MNQFFSNEMYSEYTNHTDLGRHIKNNGMARKRQGSLASFFSATADAVDEQQENRSHSSRFSKAPSTYRLSSHKAHKFGAASLGGYGTISGGTKKYGADLLPDIYDEIFRLPAKVSSTSKFSDLPVLDPTAYYDEEDLFSSSTVMRNNFAAGVIYADVFGGGLATGPSYTDLNDLLECFGVSNSRSGEASSSSSGIHAQSPSAMASSFRHEPDEEELSHSSKPKSTSKHLKPLQSRSVNAFWHKNVEEESYNRLNREHTGCQSKRGSRRSLKNGETQKERKGEVRQAFEPPLSVQKSSPLSTDTDPVSVVQSSCSKDFSGLTSCGTNSSSHNYTSEWLKSIDNFTNRSESIKFLNHDMEASVSPNWKEEMPFEDHFSPSENFESIKSFKGAKVTSKRAQKERYHEEVWLTVDELKLKTGPSMTPPPSRLPPLPRGIPNAVPLRMPDRHAQGNGHARSKVHANGQKSQESAASTESDPELNFSVSSAHNEAAADGMNSTKEAKVSTGDDAIPYVKESEILLSLKADVFNNKVQIKEREILIGAAKKEDTEEQVKVADNKDQGGKQQEENMMSFTVDIHTHEMKQKEKETTAVKNLEHKEEEMMMNATVMEHVHGIEPIERKTILVDKVEHKEEEMAINAEVTEHVHETEQKERKTISAENVEHKEEETIVQEGTEQKERKTISAANVEHKEEETIVHGTEQKERKTILAEIVEHKEEETIVHESKTFSAENVEHKREETIVHGTEQKERKTISAENVDHKEEETMVHGREQEEWKTISAENVEHREKETIVHGTVQKERKTISAENVEHKEEETVVHGTEQKERKTISAENVEHKEEETIVHGTEQQGRKTISVENVEHKEEETKIHGTEQKERKTISVENEEHKEEEKIVQVIAGVQGTKEIKKKEANWNVEAMGNKDNKEVTAKDMQNDDREVAPKSEPEILENPTGGDFSVRRNEEDKRNKPSILEGRERVAQPNLNSEDSELEDKAAKEMKGSDEYQRYRKEKVLDDSSLESSEKKDWGFREIEMEIRRREREYELERQKEREMEREKDRMGLDNNFFDLRDRGLGEQKVKFEKVAINSRERPGRTPVEMATAASRERVIPDRTEKGGAEKSAVSRSRRGFAAADRFHADTSERFSERGLRPFGDIQGSYEKTHDQRNVASGSQQRTLERVAKALAEKKQRDLDAQREFAEKERIAGSLDVEIKRWSSGKEGNLRALLSTLQYVLWQGCGWQTISLTDIISSAAVKKAYRKATLCVHPDKVQQKGATIRQKYIAEKVFDLLKEAWNKFNIDEQK